MFTYEQILEKYNTETERVNKLEAAFVKQITELPESKLDDMSAAINTAYKELKNARKLLIHAAHPLSK